MTTSTITSVTLFTDRARITRAAKVTVQPGVQKVTIGDLPLALDPDSVRARGAGTARAKLLGVTTRIENFVETPAQYARELEAQAQALADAIAELDARGGAIQKEQASLENLMGQGASFAKGINKGQRSAGDQIATLAALRERLVVLQADGLTLARERRDRAKELDKVQRQLAELGNAQPRQRYCADVEIDVQQAGDIDLELTHNVHGASWRPMYDLRYADASIELRYLAEVAQNTGEDWGNVALTLSTAQPNASLIVPELDPWYIMPKPPPRPPAHKMAQARSADAGGMMMPQAMPAPAMMAMQASGTDTRYGMAVDDAVIAANGAALNYALPARAGVPGNGDPRKVTVAVFSLKPRMDYITAPKLDATVYRRCTVKNESPYTLLPGQAQLFEGDGYLGACAIELTAPNQEMELALGADERVRVERELTQREVDKTLLGDKRRTRFGYKTTIENLRSESISLLLRDQLPVSQSEDIKTRLETADPKPSEQSDLNLLEWKLLLPAGEKRVVKFEFTVEHPRSMEIMGLG